MLQGSGSIAAVSDGARESRGVYSIGAVDRMLGIAVATIRNWEDRYGSVVPERSAGGHRLYSRDQIEQLRFVAAEISRGLSAADAHRLLAEPSEGGHPLGNGGRSGGPRLLVLLAERDPVAADRRVSKGAWGWAGAYGTNVHIEPQEKMVTIILMQTSTPALQRDFENAVFQAIVK